MSPQEKAKDLVYSMLPFCQKDTYGRSQIVNAKQCALIAVDEILTNKNLLLVGSRKYWQQVKAEIEKL